MVQNTLASHVKNELKDNAETQQQPHQSIWQHPQTSSEREKRAKLPSTVKHRIANLGHVRKAIKPSEVEISGSFCSLVHECYIDTFWNFTVMTTKKKLRRERHFCLCAKVSGIHLHVFPIMSPSIHFWAPNTEGLFSQFPTKISLVLKWISEFLMQIMLYYRLNYRSMGLNCTILCL